MTARRGAVLAAIGVVATLGGAIAPTASAQPAPPCPDVEVIFARGTSEPPGVGATGQAFIDSLRAQAGGRSVGVYPVNYPAGDNFGDGAAFVSTVVDGVRDAADHVQATAAACPDTKVVLGGYSQGAVVSGFATAAETPTNLPVASLPEPMPPDVAGHVAAVVLFANPSAAFLSQYGVPAATIGPLYADKTLQLCDPGDSICSGVPGGGPNIAHVMYTVNGAVNQGAAYAAGHLN